MVILGFDPDYPATGTVLPPQLIPIPSRTVGVQNPPPTSSLNKNDGLCKGHRELAVIDGCCRGSPFRDPEGRGLGEYGDVRVSGFDENRNPDPIFQCLDSNGQAVTTLFYVDFVCIH
jgi:hypothetical protein